MFKPIWKIARHMRIRPEAVFQIISDAFDTSIRDNTLTSDAGGLHFEADIAAFTLTHSEEGAFAWQLSYKAKEPMINKAILPHTKEEFTIPERLDNGIGFPFFLLRKLNQLITGDDEILPEELADQLITAYQSAWEKGEVERRNYSVKFNTSLKAQDGAAIYAVIEPDYYDPVPNIWKLSSVQTE